jgi:hypothetical protein
LVQTHEERPEQSRRRAVEPRQADVDLQSGHGNRPAQDAVLRLQRSVGNQVVARTLAEDDPSTVPDVLRSPGRPLDTATRTEFESRFGADFADVRVHTGAAAERSAAEIGARAYTSGSHVVIGEQGDDPHTMAHELTHVLQQRQGPVRGAQAANGVQVSSPDDEFERAAEATATEVLRAPVAAQGMPGQRRSTAHQSRPSVVYRAPSVKPDPVLSATPAGKPLEGLCGYFVRARTWNLANAVKGLVIQKVTRTFNVEAHQGGGVWASISGTALDNYVTDPNASVHATDTEYWEVWEVGPRGGFTPKNKKDTFALTSLIPDANSVTDSTKGSFVIRGEAYFYPTDKSPADLGFGTNVAAAGGLFSRASDPASDLTTNGVTAVGSAVIYTVTVTWDSTDSTTKDREGYPVLALSVVQAS